MAAKCFHHKKCRHVFGLYTYVWVGSVVKCLTFNYSTAGFDPFVIPSIKDSEHECEHFILSKHE